MYPGKGPQLAMTHSWNADPSQSGMFGSGWRFAYEWDITKTSSGAILRKGSGQELAYTGSTATSPVALAAPSGYYDTLIWMGLLLVLGRKEHKMDVPVCPGGNRHADFKHPIQSDIHHGHQWQCGDDRPHNHRNYSDSHGLSRQNHHLHL